MVSVVTFLGVAIVVFYLVGKSDVRSNSNKLEYLFDHPFIFAMICFAPVLISIAFVCYYRKRNYIVGYHFDDDLNVLQIVYRGISAKNSSSVAIVYQDLQTTKFSERKMLFNPTYQGIRINSKSQALKLDFVTNNFIWEEQPRERVYFIEELERISTSVK